MTPPADSTPIPPRGGSEPEEESAPHTSAESHSYLPRLTRQRLLSVEEEQDLSARMHRGDKRAKDRLIEANMRLVINIAKNYHSALIPFEDLVQEGAIGLVTATERFDPARGFRFSTYATYWIRQSISRAIDNKSKAIRIPAHVSEAIRKLEKMRDMFFRERGVEPSLEELSLHTGVSMHKISSLLQAGQDPLSLDMLVGNEENTPLSALINDASAENPQQAVLTEERREALRELLQILTPREREVMRLRLGFEEDSSEVLQEIGIRMHLSRERVRQIEIQALRKLKHAAKRRNLLGYLSD
jgi:RNA polymerase primary sigma factor